jgi:hypothetical protein
MGLDMYMTGRKYVGGSLQDWPEKPKFVQDGFPVEKVELELGYWRKHRKLHGYIVNTFANGVDECQEIPLEVSDLRNIAKAVREKNLPYTKGCFFGNDEFDKEEEERREEHAQVLEHAAEWLDSGDWKRTVFYRASW